MSKLPTFEAKKVGGASAAPEMRANQRMMTKPFRKSTNINSSDFYNSAGTAAMGQVINNAINLYGHVKQKQKQAELEKIRAERNSAFALFAAKLNQSNTGNEDIQANDFLEKNEEKYTSSKDKQIKQKLNNEYLQLSTNLKINAIKKVDQNATKTGLLAYSNNLEKIKSDLAGDPTLIESSLTKVRAHVTELLNSGIINNEEEAKEMLRIANNQLHDASLKSMVNKSNTIEKLNEMQEPLKEAYTNGDITYNEFTAIENIIENKKNKIQEINKIRLKDQFNEINKSALQGENLSEEDLQIFGQIFGHKELLKLEDSIEETTVKYLAYDKIKAPLFRSDEQIDSYRAEIVFSLKKEYPEYSSQIPGWVDDALNVRKSARNEAIKNEDNSVIYEGMGKILEGDLHSEDLEKFAFDKTGRESTSAIKRIQQELNKDAPGTLQVYMSKSMGIDYFDLNSNASKLFNPNVSLEDKGDILKNIANDYKTLINKYKSSLPHTESFLPNNIVTSVSNTFLDDMPDSAVRRKETVGFLQTLVGKENLYAASKQISKNFGKDKSVAAEMLAISDGFLNRKEDVADFINNANIKWNALNEDQQNLIEVDFIKDFADEGGNAYDPVLFEERKRLALKLYSQSKDIKSALSMSFDQSTIQVQGYSSSFISIPNSYYSNLNSQTVKLTDNDKTKISETLDTVSELLSYNIQEVISWDEIDKFSSRQDGKYTDVNSSNPFKREKARKAISDMVDDKSFYYRFNPNGNAISLYFKDKENGYGELVMNMPLDNILEVKTLEVEDFTDVYGVIGNKETHLESKKNRLNFIKDLAK